MANLITLMQLADILKENKEDIVKDVSGKLQDKRSRENMSLIGKIRETMITSRVYINQELATEPILKDVLSNVYNMYTAFIFTALQIDRYVENGRKVRDFIKTVATEEFRDIEIIAKESFSMEKPQDDRKLSSPKEIKPIPNDVNLPTGRIIGIDLSGGEDGKTKISLNLSVQLFPYFLTPDVAEQFVSLNFNASSMQRMMQYSAGEIKFWRDFVFQRDQILKRKQAMIKDKSGVLADMLDKQNNSLFTSLSKRLDMPGGRGRDNIANNILIFDKQKFMRYCNNSNVKWSNTKFSDRQDFFDRTFSMIVILVDTMYDRIEFYFNSLDQIGTYTFDQIKSNATKETYDLKDIINAFSKGMAPNL